MEVQTIREGVRGCGWRKKGGMYLMGGIPSQPCGLLPIPLTVCPCCGGGIKQSRGWSWIEPAKLIRFAETKDCRFPEYCEKCPVRAMYDEELGGRHGLLWVGKQHYSSQAFAKEAMSMGISKRINAIPQGFEVGKHWVLLAHPHAIAPEKLKFGDNPDDPMPGIFMIFKPDRIEYVVKGNETSEELESLVERGLTLVNIERAQDSQDSFLDI